jgi:hypothetical protein
MVKTAPRERRHWWNYGKNESAFSRYPTIKKWRELGHDKIVELLPSIKSGLLRGVNDLVVPGEPKTVMVLAITESCATLEGFCTFLTSTHKSLVEYGMSEHKAWRLTSRLGESFFRKLATVRVGKADSFELKTKHQLAALVWYGVTQTLDLMAEFARLGYKNHPTIAGEYIKFIVQNNNSEAASTFDTQMEALEDRFKKAETHIKTATTQASGAGNKAGAVETALNAFKKLLDPKIFASVKDFKSLDKRVQKLE